MMKFVFNSNTESTIKTIVTFAEYRLLKYCNLDVGLIDFFQFSLTKTNLLKRVTFVLIKVYFEV